LKGEIKNRIDMLKAQLEKTDAIFYEKIDSKRKDILELREIKFSGYKAVFKFRNAYIDSKISFYEKHLKTLQKYNSLLNFIFIDDMFFLLRLVLIKTN
jgi:hypothetical protein